MIIENIDNHKPLGAYDADEKHWSMDKYIGILLPF